MKGMGNILFAQERKDGRKARKGSLGVVRRGPWVFLMERVSDDS